MAPGNVNPAVEIREETIHPELLELTMEIIKNRHKMEEEQQEGNISSAVEHVDVVEKDSSVMEKGSSIAEKDPSVVEDLDVAEKAQDVEIGAGLMTRKWNQLARNLAWILAQKMVKKMFVPPLQTANFKTQKRWLKASRNLCRIMDMQSE